MYEPIYLPQLNEPFAPLRDARVGITYKNKYVAVNSPTIEPLHLHPYIEIFFNVSSEVSFLINNKLYPVAHGSAVVLQPNEIHMCLFNKSCMHEYFCLWLDAAPDSPLLSFLQAKDFSPLLIFDTEAQQTLKTLLFCLNNDDDVLEQNAALLHFLVLLKKQRQSVFPETTVPPQLQAILDDINEHFAEIHSITSLLDTHFVSSSTFNRWFRRYLHVSPHEFLESKKLSHAATLLLHGDSVMTACVEAGFSDCSHFIRLFKKKFGETPLKYKQKLQKHF